LKLGAGTFKIAVMEKQVQPADDALFAAAQQGGEMTGTQKPVSVNEPENIVVEP
jgi:hypothetical protein